MDLVEIKARLQQAGVDPDRARGQNFLLDEDVVKKMTLAAGLNDRDLVVEVGPGLGVLTQALTKQAKRVLAIELEDAFSTSLGEILQHPANLDVIKDDALASSAFHATVFWLAKQLSKPVPGKKEPTYQDLLQTMDGSYKIIANLPYQITSRALRHFLEDKPRPSQVVVMVQKEVAERATAPAGQMSLLSLSVQAYSDAKLAFVVPSSSFYPQPEVDSAVLVCDLTHPDPSYAALSAEERARFWRIARAGFAARRKQLRNNLKSVFPDVDAILKACGIDPQARAQELSVQDWCRFVKM